jgi:uncharacterized GH25 family protein
MLRSRLSLALPVLLLTTFAPSDAHEIKALASQLRVEKPGGKTTIYLAWGHILPVDDLVVADTLARFDLLLPSGKTTALRKEGRSLQTNVVEMEEPGISQVVVERKPGIVTYVVDAAGNRVMKRGPKSGITEGKIDYAMRSQQFAKALIVTGKGEEAAPKAVGSLLEILPLQGPTSWRAGHDVRFKVLFQGKPVTEEEVLATYVGFKPDKAWCFATPIDHDGVATVRPSQPGTWVIKVHLRQPAEAKFQKEYEFETYTATLALEIVP